MRGITDNCFKSFLQDWYQYSNIKESSSERLLITNDVPQVSFRGPLLFLLHINALFSVSLFRWYKSPPYRKNKKKINKHISHDLRHLWQWIRSNKLWLNGGKTKKIVLRNRYQQINKNLIFRVSREQINPTSSVRHHR